MHSIIKLPAIILTCAALSPGLARAADAVCFSELGQRGQALTQSIPPGWQLVSDISPVQGKATDADRQRGFVVIVSDWLQPVTPDSFPVGSDKQEIKIFAAQGEYEPAVFAIRSFADADFTVKVTPPTDKAGHTIPSANIDLRQVQSLRLKKECSDKQYYYQPAYLEKFEKNRIAANTTRQFWVTIKTPDHAVPGIYKGAIDITTADGSARLDLLLRILPFQLQRPEKNYGSYFPGRIYSNHHRARYLYPETLPKLFAAYREHGLNSACFSEILPLMKYENDRVTADFNEIEKIVDQFVAAGLNGALILDTRLIAWWTEELATILRNGYTLEPHRYTVEELNHIPAINLEPNIKARWDKDYRFTKFGDDLYLQVIAQLKDIIKRHGWKNVVIMPEEELGNGGIKLLGYEHYAPLVKAQGLKVILIDLMPHMGIDSGRKYKEFTDIRQYNLITAQLRQSAREDQREFWIYNRGWTRLGFGFYLSKIEASGIHQWADMWPDDPPYGEFQNRYYSWFLFYPAADGPLPTVWSEWTREGIDDGAYVFTLETLLKKAEKGSPDAQVQATASRQVLERLMAKMPITNEEYAKYQTQNGAGVFFTDRWLLANEIIKLQNILNGVKK